MLPWQKFSILGIILKYLGNYLNWLQFANSKKNSFRRNWMRKYGILQNSITVTTVNLWRLIFSSSKSPGWILSFRTTDWNIYIQHFSLRLNPWQVWTCPTINYSIYLTKCGRPLSWRNLTWPLTFCLNYPWVRKWWNSSINFQTNLILIVTLWPQQTTFLR